MQAARIVNCSLRLHSIEGLSDQSASNVRDEWKWKLAPSGTRRGFRIPSRATRAWLARTAARQPVHRLRISKALPLACARGLVAIVAFRAEWDRT